MKKTRRELLHEEHHPRGDYDNANLPGHPAVFVLDPSRDGHRYGLAGFVALAPETIAQALKW